MVSNSHDDIDQVRNFLAQYNLTRYCEVFVREGFDRLLSVSVSLF